MYIDLVDSHLRAQIDIIDRRDDHDPIHVQAAETLLCQHIGIDLGQVMEFSNRNDRFQLVVDKVATHDDR